MVDTEAVKIIKETIVDIVVKQQKLSESVKNLNAQKKQALGTYMQTDKPADAKTIADIEAEKENRKTDIKQLKDDLKANASEYIKLTSEVQ